MPPFMTMSTLTPNEYVLVGFVGFWGLVGVGIISAAVYIWLKERQSAAHQHLRPRRRRRL
jgi:hypothetical protein